MFCNDVIISDLMVLFQCCSYFQGTPKAPLFSGEASSRRCSCRKASQRFVICMMLMAFKTQARAYHVCRNHHQVSRSVALVYDTLAYDSKWPEPLFQKLLFWDSCSFFGFWHGVMIVNARFSARLMEACPVNIHLGIDIIPIRRHLFSVTLTRQMLCISWGPSVKTYLVHLSCQHQWDSN